MRLKMYVNVICNSFGLNSSADLKLTRSLHKFDAKCQYS
jgi:hypothetical protein